MPTLASFLREQNTRALASVLRLFAFLRLRWEWNKRRPPYTDILAKTEGRSAARRLEHQISRKHRVRALNLWSKGSRGDRPSRLWFDRAPMRRKYLFRRSETEWKSIALDLQGYRPESAPRFQGRQSHRRQFRPPRGNLEQLQPLEPPLLQPFCVWSLGC